MIVGSFYHEHAVGVADPGRRSALVRRDDEIKDAIERVHENSFGLYARRIVDLKVSTSATAGFLLDVLEQAVYASWPGPEDGLIHYSDSAIQYLALNYTKRLAEATSYR